MNAEQSGLIEKNLGLVTRIVVQQCAEFPIHVDREELIRAGTLGLVEAARRYDPAKGLNFASFAGFRIRGAVIDALRTHDWAPRSVRRAARDLEVARNELTVELHRPPTSAELGDKLGLSAEAVVTLEQRIRRSAVLSLDRPTTDDEAGSVADSLADDAWADPNDALEDCELRNYLRDAVRLLPERHRIVIVGYFFENRTSDDLAHLLAVSESRISQLRSEAFIMLKDAIEAQYSHGDGDGDEIDVRDASHGRAARRRAALAAALAESRPWKARLDDDDRELAVVA